MPRLVPMPANEGATISLDGQWQFNAKAPAPTAKIAKGAYPDQINVPGQWLQQGFTVNKGGYAGYAREFTVPTRWRSEQIFIRFDAVFSQCEVWVNGQKVGEHLGGFTPFDVDITNVARTGGNNTLMLNVRSESIADSAANASRYACHPLGGISRKVTMFAVPRSSYATYMNATTTFKDKEFKDATLNLEMANSAPADILIELYDTTQNSSIASTTCQYTSTTGEIERMSLPFHSPKLWDPEHPNLYLLRVTTTAPGAKQGEIIQRHIGFRHIEVRGARVLVNGQPIKLRGVNHHEVMPLRGRSMVPGQWERDVELFRNANVNYIRTSHYPPAPELVEACDRLGMFLEIEAPFCWAHEATVTEKARKAVLEDQTFTMINLFKSNPSVLMWSAGNESNKWVEYFSRTAAKIAVIDPTRPRIFSQWGPDADQGALEVTNYHYPGPNIAQFGASKRPITFDEFCHVNSYNRLEYITDPAVRDRWGIALRDMWEKMYATPSILGGGIWAGIDDTFVLNDGKVVGYGTWGPLDGWRRPKPEYWHVKKVFSPVKVTLNSLSHEGVLSLNFENRFHFTNLNECQIEWQAAGQSGTLKLDTKQGTKITTEIHAPHGAKELTLHITDPRGVEVDRYLFTIAGTPQVTITPSAIALSSITESGDTITARVDSLTATIVRSSGAINIYKGTTQVVCATPTLMVLPLNSEGYGIQMTGEKRDWSCYTPVCSGRLIEDVAIESLPSGAIQIRLRERYIEAAGETTYTLGAASRINVEFEYTICKDVNPRQWGLVFALPGTFNRLDWNSRGIWNFYPEDHIARPTGTTMARNANLDSGPAGPIVNPHCDWKDDQNRWGTNDFRSTKHNITRAALVSASRGGIRFEVNGTQGLNTRSWIDAGSGDSKGSGQIRMLIAPYSNLGSEGFLRSHAELHDKPLKVGDKIKGGFDLNIK